MILTDETKICLLVTSCGLTDEAKSLRSADIMWSYMRCQSQSICNLTNEGQSSVQCLHRAVLHTRQSFICILKSYYGRTDEARSLAAKRRLVLQARQNEYWQSRTVLQTIPNLHFTS